MPAQPTNNMPIITHQISRTFWPDHAGRLIKDPEIAIVELVANAWDAGANEVRITYPEQIGDMLIIEDNETGMTQSEFESRWTVLNYNRIDGGQGENVVFPQNVLSNGRTAYGRNGKGRHSMFCFSFEYWIETWQNGKCNTYRIKKEDSGRHPFVIIHEASSQCDGHGTKISAQLLNDNHYLPIDQVRTLIGSKFISDPSFNIYINNERIELSDLEDLIENEITVSIPPYGEVTVLLINSQRRGRISLHHGVAWWVNRRVVGTPSWRGFEVGKYIDGRTSEARQYTFVVLADLLQDSVLADWTGFDDTDKTTSVVSKVNEVIQQEIYQLFWEVRKDTKKKILSEHKDEINKLSKVAQKKIGVFIDSLQQSQPTITDKYLSSAVGVLTNIELSRTGYKLLEQLAELSPDDFDSLRNEINITSTFVVNFARTDS